MSDYCRDLCFTIDVISLVVLWGAWIGAWFWASYHHPQQTRWRYPQPTNWQQRCDDLAAYIHLSLKGTRREE